MKSTCTCIVKLSLVVLFLFLSQIISAQVLVSGTTFEPVNITATKTYYGINDISQIGLQSGAFSITPTLTPDTEAGTFNAPYNYAITDNPINLDADRYVDNSASPEYMFVYSTKPTGGNANILQYKVTGMVPNSPVTVTVKYCSVVSTTATVCTNERTEFKAG